MRAKTVFVSCFFDFLKPKTANNFSPFILQSMSLKRKLTSSATKVPSPKKQKSLDNFVQRVAKSPIAETTTIASKTDSWLADLLTESEWKRKLNVEFRKKYFKDIEKYLTDEYSNGKEIFPPKHLIFNAFNLTPLSKIKVVILGQDPYHDKGQAHGLSFSVPKGIRPPPSLINIYKELSSDIDGFKIPSHGCLEKWAKEGVLLLNASLTVQAENPLAAKAGMARGQPATISAVCFTHFFELHLPFRAHKANSHATIGWQTFTDAAIKVINDECDGVVFILWGGFAQKKDKLINKSKHHVINTAHPSPLSVSRFMGCKCFSKANEVLKEKYKKSVVDWLLE